LIRRREAPGGPKQATFTIRVCPELTQCAHRAFNGAKGNHRLSNHGGLAIPYLSRDPRPVGSQPPFRVGQSSNPYPDYYGLAFACSDIPYPLALGRSLAGVRPHPCGGSGAYHVPHAYHPEGRRPRLTAGSAPSAQGNGTRPRPDCLPFGSCLSASLACCLSRRLNSGSHELALSFNPSSRPPLRLAVATSPRGSVARLSGGGYSVPSASHPGVTPSARLGRVPVAEHRIFRFLDKYACDLVSHVPGRRRRERVAAVA